MVYVLVYLAGFTLTSFILSWSSSKTPTEKEVRQIALLTVFWPVTYVIITTLLVIWVIGTLLMSLVYIVEWLWEEGITRLGKRILGK